MNLKQLQYFLAVAEEKQITAAAKRLFIAQPPLSYQLKQLEKELGVKLFRRTAYGIELTDAGIELQSYAEEILNLAETAQNKVQKTAKGELGTIKIGSASSSVGELPSDKFFQLKKFYPEISFDIYEENSFGVIKNLQNGTIDLGIVRTPFNHHGIESKNITDEKMTLVTKDQKILKNKKIDLKFLKDRPLIIYRRFENIFNQSFSHLGIKPFYAVKCDDSRTAILWAQKGMGDALVPESIANLYAKDQFVVINHKGWETHLQLIWKKQKLSPLTKRIINLFD
ncbi:LysR family transcriptional regulator [Lactobacillus agrestimuris]|uniref:LysR family transcriptional regulator n=1 Tax=Lactobacillus agrestimuris TaxID=2941328 RepID=UPI0019BBE836|nr:LysR family transcriptional regulator [Lactobacillus agrestimuris]MBD5431685.1 LysR family transcriptional regulator [Lactobacillus sp.]